MGLDIHAIKSVFWRRFTMIASFPLLMVWHFLVSPCIMFVRGGLFEMAHDFASGVLAFKGLSDEWTECWG